jgi:hypothetical protein
LYKFLHENCWCWVKVYIIYNRLDDDYCYMVNVRIKYVLVGVEVDDIIKLSYFDYIILYDDRNLYIYNDC